MDNHFNPSPPTIMHVDLNSCFASVEQQANPLLRGRPVAVAAYTTGRGCILAASREAKQWGVKTGMRVREGRTLCPALVILPSNPVKYRFVNQKLLVLLGAYTADIDIKSIDEMVLNLAESPALERFSMVDIAREIKGRIKSEIGEWLTVSVGIAPNRFLAKTAAGLHKPDGLDVIDGGNVEEVLFHLGLEDLCGIKTGNAGRLRLCGIRTTRDFYRASPQDLERAFRSIVGRHWWLRLHGYEADARAFGRKSFGHSYALYKPYTPADAAFAQILTQLVVKMGRRLRRGGYRARGIHPSFLFTDGSFWHESRHLAAPVFADAALYQAAISVIARAPAKPVRIAAVSCFALTHDLYAQQSFLSQEKRLEAVTRAVDSIADRWGEFTVMPGRMLAMETRMLDRIAFGGVGEDGFAH